MPPTPAPALAGGTASVLGGGKFENGAATGAFGYLYNELGSLRCKMSCHGIDSTEGRPMTESEELVLNGLTVGVELAAGGGVLSVIRGAKGAGVAEDFFAGTK